MHQSTKIPAGVLRPVLIDPDRLVPGDRLRDHGQFRIVARVERPSALRDMVLVVFEPDAHGDTLGVAVRVRVVAWRAAR